MTDEATPALSSKALRAGDRARGHGTARGSERDLVAAIQAGGSDGRHTGLTLWMVVRGSEGARSAAQALAGVGVLVALMFCALSVVLLMDGKPMAPVLLVWWLLGLVVFAATLVILRSAEVKTWTSARMFGEIPD